PHIRMRGVSEHGIEPGLLFDGQERFTRTQHLPYPVERVPTPPAMPEGLLLYPLPYPVKHVAGELDDMERVHHLCRIGELFSRCSLEPGEPVHCDDLDLVFPRLRPRSEPLGEHTL